MLHKTGRIVSGGHPIPENDPIAAEAVRSRNTVNIVAGRIYIRSPLFTVNECDSQDFTPFLENIQVGR
jgi:hypothetical protein